MNVQRSPVSGSGLRSNSASGGSQPDLRQALMIDKEAETQSFRNKRKHGEDSPTKFDDFEARMSKLLTDFTTKQTEKMEAISEDVATIKYQVGAIKLTTDKLVLEQQKINAELANVLTFKADTEQKIQIIQSDIESLKATSKLCLETKLPKPSDYEEMTSEIRERSLREKNIIICGIPEIDSKVRSERFAHDKKETIKSIKQIIPDCEEPHKIVRLGKYNPEKPRALKVCFTKQETAKEVLRKRNSINDSLKIYSDETPCQKIYLKLLQDELKRRIESGEQDICIKYVKGTPKITPIIPKNSQQKKTPLEK
ncbi:hypothetical protein O0L34_g2985 [Tuta absoluta]|nr:hypothetical protein O0L34_g2985 [Tuta absoluta]